MQPHHNRDTLARYGIAVNNFSQVFNTRIALKLWMGSIDTNVFPPIGIESVDRVCDVSVLRGHHIGHMVNSLPKSVIHLLLPGFCCSPLVAAAQSHWMACPVPDTYVDTSQRPAGLTPGAVYIEADTALFRERGTSEMSGNVHISQQDKTLHADKATYDQATANISGVGNVNFITPSMQVKSSRLQYNLTHDTGEIHNASYQMKTAEGRGSSKRIVQENPDLTRLETASYTTCPTEQADWSFNSPDIRLQHDKEQGTARNVTLKIRNTPVLYLPYLSFPLTDARKSGFLWPNIGTNEKSGLQISAPYYFNLAPNYDLTLTPTLLSRRGIQVGSEFRYLTDKHTGSVNYVLLPDDRVSTIENNRYYYKLEDNTRINNRSTLKLKAEGVSDDQYFVDLGNSLEATSVVNLERRLEYYTQEKDWTFSTMLQNYQVLDGGTSPHARLPQLQLKYNPTQKPGGLDLSAEGEYTNFTASDTSTNGSRLDLKARVSKKFANDASYIKPSLTMRHTEYRLDDADNTKISRTLPTASVDSGLVFERNVKQGQYVQTLEPRLFYTYTPYKDQSAIPIFDSSERSLSYNQLFAENRFTGKDRIGDTNRISASLTTRIQDPKAGSELFRASIGQMYHFDDRNVTMPNETPQQGDRSELVLEAAGQINRRTQISSTAYWDNDKSEVAAGEVRLRYKDDKKRILNVGYAQRKDDFESANVSFSVPVKPQWKAVGSVERDLLNERNLETVLGAEYESCCWKTRIAARNYLLPDNQTKDNAVFIEFELKGLGNFGSSTRNLLQERIYGYE